MSRLVSPLWRLAMSSLTPEERKRRVREVQEVGLAQRIAILDLERIPDDFVRQAVINTVRMQIGQAG